jgi:hypothetical protein
MTGTRSEQRWTDRGTSPPDGPVAATAPQRRSALDPNLLLLLRAVRVALWSVAHFVFYFVQQLAELLAPLLLIAGVGWWALPKVIGAITSQATTADAQARDLLNTLPGNIPQAMELAGHHITPGILITDGLLLMALAAIGATLSALAARGM